ncbi:MAG: carboxypeptidase regulatory-like domain-containing protein [Bryobacterales bacterium]|nr:carboxypeptidase regulatory-like domain-containing protein [Bryobacterales bacterium]
MLQSRYPVAGRILLVLTLTAAFGMAALFSQESRGTIVGTVTDQSGTAIPGATVEVTNKAQGAKQVFRSNESGLYQAPYLIPGDYEVAATFTGFKRAVRPNVTVSVGDRVSIDMVLEIGATDQSITVTAESPLLESATGSVGQVVDSKRITELPIAHGQPFALIGLSAGVSQNIASATLDRPFEPTHIVGYAINGTRQNRSDVTIDGIPSTATANANEVTASYVPPADIVQEFKVQSATFDAQFGNTEGGVTNISIKSGTNDFHGSAYYYKMSPSLFANQWFANAQSQARTNFDYDRWGGSAGGPVFIPKFYDGRNRTFFMWGYEQFSESRPRNNGTKTTLTEANMNGDFSALLGLNSAYQIYNPFTRRQTTAGVYQADPFPGNQIPSALISPVAKSLLQYWPKPLGPGLSDGRQNLDEPNLLEVIDYMNHTVRVDHNISDSDRLATRLSWYDRDSNYNDYFHTLATGQWFQFISRAASADYVKILSPTLVLNVRYGYNRFVRVTAMNPAAKGFDLTSVGFASAYSNQIPGDLRAFPGIEISGYQGTNGGAEYRPNDTHAFVATLNQTLGSHAVKYGFEFRGYRETATFSGNDGVGRFTFDTAYTRGPLSTAAAAPNNLGQSAAAFLLGLPTTSSVTRLANYAEQSTSYSGFVHDDWRVNDRLTLNLGIRYEVEGALRERWNRSLRGFDPTASTTLGGKTYLGLVTVPGVGGEPSGLYNTPKANLLPRFGFAYKLNAKTVLRGGYGIYYGFLGQRRGDVVLTGFSRTTTLNATSNNIDFVNTLSNVFTTPILEPRSPADIPASLMGTGFTFFNENPKTSQQQRWQLNVQRELGGGWVAEAGYVGNRGTRIDITRNINALPLQYLSTSPTRDNATNTYLSAQVDNPLAGLLPGTSLNNAKTARSNLLRPFPLYGDLNTTTNQGYTWYHSLQASAQKRFSHGYTLMLSYTWSKFMQATEYLNAADPMPTEMISDADTPHRLSISGIYELPFGKGQRFFASDNPVLSRIVGGWQLQGIYTYQSGRPIPITSNGTIFTGNFADLNLDKPTVEKWFNTANFNTIANQQLVSNVRTFPLRFSNLRFDDLSAVDFSVIKGTAITENVNLQFRAEALNAFNSPNFGAVDVNPTSANFGRVTGVNNYARRIQLGLRLVF